jgi:hypothetical protein
MLEIIRIKITDEPTGSKPVEVLFDLLSWFRSSHSRIIGNGLFEQNQGFQIHRIHQTSDGKKNKK